MRAYLWTVLILFVLAAFGCMSWIARDVYPKRTRGMALGDLFLYLFFAGWAAHLLLTEA